MSLSLGSRALYGHGPADDTRRSAPHLYKRRHYLITATITEASAASPDMSPATAAT